VSGEERPRESQKGTKKTSIGARGASKGMGGSKPNPLACAAGFDPTAVNNESRPLCWLLDLLKEARTADERLANALAATLFAKHVRGATGER
jgi:hypothetical protein